MQTFHNFSRANSFYAWQTNVYYDNFIWLTSPTQNAVIAYSTTYVISKAVKVDSKQAKETKGKLLLRKLKKALGKVT